MRPCSWASRSSFFVMGDKHPLVKADVETNAAKRRKLKAFRERAKQMKPGSPDRVYATFDSLEEFTSKAIHAVANLRRYLDEQGSPSPQPQTASQTPASTAAESERNLVFVSYSHYPSDKGICEDLLKMMRPTARKHGVKLWSDHEIPPGAIWRDEVRKLLAHARVAVLLVSPDFLDSSFIQQNELPPLLEAARNGGCRIFWVACRPCNEGDTKNGRFQCARPTGKTAYGSQGVRPRE